MLKSKIVQIFNFFICPSRQTQNFFTWNGYYQSQSFQHQYPFSALFSIYDLFSSCNACPPISLILTLLKSSELLFKYFLLAS